MQEMSGSFDYSENTYNWWAGNAAPAPEGKYCVHCWRKKIGVTRYTDEELTHSQAEQIAQDLAPVVERIC